MTVNLKIEILKVFLLEFGMSSDKELKLKKGKTDEKADDDTASAPADNKPASSSK